MTNLSDMPFNELEKLLDDKATILADARAHLVNAKRAYDIAWNNESDASFRFNKVRYWYDLRKMGFHD